MRVISGSAKGRKLYFSQVTRPLSQKAKAGLFSTITSRMDLSDISVLDLFAGSGSLGIESLSRGAKSADFVELSKNAYKQILKNIYNTSFQDKSQVFNTSAERFIHLEKFNKYDLIFVFPPYDQTNIRTVRNAAELLNKNGMLILEHHKKFKPAQRIKGLSYLFTKTYSITSLSFYIKSNEE